MNFDFLFNNYPAARLPWQYFENILERTQDIKNYEKLFKSKMTLNYYKNNS